MTSLTALRAALSPRRLMAAPDALIERQLARAQEHREDGSRVRRPGWDLRMVPAALIAWGAALCAGQGLLREAWWAAAALTMLGILLTAAALAGPRRRGRRAAAIAGAAAPTVLLCAAVGAAVLLQAGGQLSEAAQRLVAMGPGPQRLELVIADRPVAWQSGGSGLYGPAPEDVGEASSGVVVPVQLDDGTEAVLFAQDPQWRQVQVGSAVEAVVGEPELERGQLRLSSSSPPAPADGTAAAAQDESQAVGSASGGTTAADGPLEVAQQRFAVAAAARGPDAAGLLPGMTFGDRAGLEKPLADAMKATGLTHLTAVSGSNCALVMALTGQFALGFGLRRRLCVVAGLAGLALFVVLVGPDPSVLRASVMGAVSALAILSGRGPVSLAALSSAMCVLLVIDPGLGTEYGFALSVCATAGIVVTGRPLIRMLELGMPTALATALSIPLTAQLWCGPVMAMLTPTVAVYSLLANVIAAPAVPLITVVGLLSLLLLGLGGLPGALGALLLIPGSWLTGIIAGTARRLAAWPGAIAPWPEPPLGPLLMLAVSALAVVGVHALDHRLLRRETAGRVRRGPVPGPVDERQWSSDVRRRRRWRALSVLVIGAGAVALVVVLRWPSPQVEDWSVTACDVGQGDAVLVRGREGAQESTVLIDAGPDPAAVRRCLQETGVQRLDLLVLTHDHADHVAGAEGLGQVVEIQEVWWSSASGRAPLELAELAAPARRPAVGENRQLPGLRLRVLGPDPAATSISPSSEDENDASLVLRLDIGEESAEREDDASFSMLAAGDLEESGLGPLLRDDPGLLDVDLLKLSHHGARNGGTAIIDAASPSLAVASVGAENDYGHPHPSITEHLARSGIPLARTDQHGAVAVRVDEAGRLLAVPGG